MLVYRVFISSVSDMLEHERRVLTDAILSKGDLPVKMELNLTSENNRTPLEVDLERIDDCDGLILIAGYIYGEVIGPKFLNGLLCPISCENREKNCGGCSGDGKHCNISYTEFEYLYAKSKKIPVFVLWKRCYDNEDRFENDIKENDKEQQKKYRKNFYGQKEENECFIHIIQQSFVKHYSTDEEYLLACSGICNELHTLLEGDAYKERAFGLIPVKQHRKKLHDLEGELYDLRDKINRYQELSNKGVTEIFPDQESVIKSLNQLKDADIYDDDTDGSTPKIRILAIRGESFVMSGHGWQPYILGHEKKGARTIEVEFILGNSQNIELIRTRYEALVKQLTKTNHTFGDFVADYQKNMQYVKEEILKIPFCTLYEHTESRLPFRMIFLGSYLYLSMFLNGTPAAEAPVFKIHKNSTLYRACDEYYTGIDKKAVREMLPLK